MVVYQYLRTTIRMHFIYLNLGWLML